MIVIKLILVVIGAIALVASYFLESEEKSEIPPENVEGLSRILEEQADYASGRLKDSVTETLDKAEDDLSRLSVKKMNEFNEFSEQILAKVDVNHKEVMFVYDMLNEKEKEVKESIGRLEDVKHEVNELIEKLNKAAENVSKETLEAENMISITQNIEKIRDQIVGEISKNKTESKKDTIKTTKVKSNDEIDEKKPIKKEMDKASDKDSKSKTVKTTKTTTKSSTKSTTKSASNKKDSEVKTQAKSLSSKKKEIVEEEEPQSNERYKNIQGEVLEYQNANEQILQLHDEGLSYIEISKKLDLGVGEVMLVINLYKNKVNK